MAAAGNASVVKRYSGLFVFLGTVILGVGATIAVLGPAAAKETLLLPEISMPAWVFVLLLSVPMVAILYRLGHSRPVAVTPLEQEAEPPGVAETFEDRRFMDKEVVLDGKVFKRCEFKSADLVLKGDGVFDMSDCQIVECRIIYDSPAAGVLDMFSSLYQDPAFQPIVEETFNQVRQGQTFS